MMTDLMQQPDEATILQHLQSTENDVLRSAAFAAGDERLESAVDQLSHLIQSTNIGVQEAAEYALRKIRGLRTIKAMLPLLRSDDAPTRNISMDILREIGSDNIGIIQPLLRDEDPDMRIFMSDILGCTGSRQAVPLLCDALLKDPEVNVRYQAAVSLGVLAYPEAVDALRQGMHDEEWVQFSVVEALTKIRADSTISALVQSLSSCSDLVASIIIDALGEMGNIKAVPLLFKTLDKASPPLRHKSVKAIVQILGGRSLSLLSSKDQVRFRAYLLEALQDEDEDIQHAALTGLSVMGDAHATKTILQLALTLDQERDHELLDAAVLAVAKIGFNESLVDCLQADNAALVRLAVMACTQANDHRCVDVIKNIFWKQERDVQRLAASYMAQAAEEQDVPFFMDVLARNEDSDVIKSALYFLGIRIKCQEAHEQIFAMLSHPHEDVKEVALEACIHLHSPDLNLRFKEFFRSNDVFQRVMAVFALSRYNLQENIAEITEALEDESPNVRQLAVEAFGAVPDIRPYFTTLLPRLNDEAKDVRTALVELLGRSGSPDVLPYLTVALSDEDEWVRIRAVEAFSTIQNDETAPKLVQMLESASPMLTFKIIDILGNMGGNVAFRALLGMMDHEDPEIQQAAAEAVSKIKADQE